MKIDKIIFEDGNQKFNGEQMKVDDITEEIILGEMDGESSIKLAITFKNGYRLYINSDYEGIVITNMMKYTISEYITNSILHGDGVFYFNSFEDRNKWMNTK